MLDEDFKLYLIEVNTNPCLETDSPLLSRIIPELINATFRLVLDPIFPCPDLTQTKKQQVNQLPIEIKYSLIFDERVDGERLDCSQEREAITDEQARNCSSRNNSP